MGYFEKQKEIKLVKPPAPTFSMVDDDIGGQFGKFVLGGEKINSIYKKQQTGLVKRKSPLNTVLGGA